MKLGTGISLVSRVLRALGGGVTPPNPPGIYGTAANTLKPLTSSAISALRLRAQAAKTLQPLTAGAVSALRIRGQASKALAPITTAAAGLLSARTAPLKLAFAGSSTPEKYFTEFTATDNSRVTASSDGATFSALGGVGLGAHALGDALVTGLNLDVKFIKAGVASTTLAQWEANGSTYRAALVNRINAAGGVDAVCWQGGFNDGGGGAPLVVDLAATIALFRSLFSKIRSETGLPNLPIFMGGSQSGPNTNTKGLSRIRAAELVVAGDANIFFACPTYDLPRVDGIHQTQAAYPVSAGRWAQTIISVFLGGAAKRGPRVVSAARVSDTQSDVTLAYGSGSDFAQTAPSGWNTSKDDTTFFTATAAKVSATVVRVTHNDNEGNAMMIYAAAPADAPDISAPLLDNTTPQNLPIEPALTVAVAAFVPTAVPTNKTAPSIPTGSKVGDTVTASRGVWGGNPTSFAYQWKRNNVAISGATSATYTYVVADQGLALKCTVKATNAIGDSAEVSSNGIVPTAANAGAHRYWKMSNIQRSGGSGTILMPEAYLYDSTGTKRNYTAATASSQLNNSPTYAPMRANDGSLTTTWATNNSEANPSFTFDFGAGSSFDVARIGINPGPNAGWPDQCPISALFSYSDDGTTFTQVGTMTWTAHVASTETKSTLS